MIASCFVNNSFSDEVLSWEENNRHVTCLESGKWCSIYVCIPMRDWGYMLLCYEWDALKDAFERELGSSKQMKSLAYASLYKWKFSVQECVHHKYKAIALITSIERLKCHKTPFVMQFTVPKKETHPEECIHHLLFMYLSFRNEYKPKYGDPPSYTEASRAPGVIDIISTSRSLIELLTNVGDNAFERYNEDIQLNIDPFGYLDNDEVEEVGN